MSSVAVKVILSPSSALASFTVRVAVSSLLMVPVPLSVAITPESPGTVKPTVKVSSLSVTSSWVVATVKVLVSLAVPVKLSAVVLAV